MAPQLCVRSPAQVLALFCPHHEGVAVTSLCSPSPLHWVFSKLPAGIVGHTQATDMPRLVCTTHILIFEKSLNYQHLEINRIYIYSIMHFQLLLKY